MADKSVDDVFAEILKDSRAIAREVIESSAKKAQTDIMLEAYDYLNRYYRNFGTPKVYKRTWQLRKAIAPVFKGTTKRGSDSITIRIGVEYDSAQLEGLYHSNSRWHQSGDAWININDYSKFSSDNGIPEPEWILDNFLKGVHVWGASPNQQKKDKESTNRLMKNFITKDIDQRLTYYIQSALMNAINKRL